ncbi:hypothetical protein LCGC14_2960390, partial [marine sediment metagenome]
TASGPYDPLDDAKDLDAILTCRSERFPFPALKAYMRSHERYNEIRRMCRAYVSVRGKMVRRNRGLLKQSLAAAERSAALLADEKHALYRDNVMAWVQYVRAELDWLTPQALACPPDGTVEPDEGFRAMVRDHCYRWGQNCWEDFGSFFRRADFFVTDRLDCRATATAKGLKVSIREHGIDWAQRDALWKRHLGTVNQNGFLQVMLDPGNTRRQVLQYAVFFKGAGGTVASFTEDPDGKVVHGGRSTMHGCPTHFEHTDSSWRFDLVVPWKQLGSRPAAGDIWRINVFSNPSVTRDRRLILCQGYEYRSDVARLAHLVFT